MNHIIRTEERHGILTPQVAVIRHDANKHREVTAWLYELAAKVERASDDEQWVVTVEPSSQTLSIELIDTEDPAELERARLTLKLLTRGLA